MKNNKAITLISLIITIIVLLILAGVTINMVLGENGLINKAKTSVSKYENAADRERYAFNINEEETIDDSARNADIISADIQNFTPIIDKTTRNYY